MDLQWFTNRWFAVQVRSRQEELCAQALTFKGYETFLPMVRFVERFPHRNSRSQFQPLFPGYLFCRFKCKPNGLLLATPGFLRVVSSGGVPDQIDDDDISNIQILVASTTTVDKWPYFQLGERVRIIAGPLTGIEGVLIRVRNYRKLVISVGAVQQSISVELHPQSIIRTADC